MIQDLPIYVRSLCKQIQSVVLHSDPKQLETLRGYLIDLAKTTIDIEIASRIKGTKP